VIDDRTVDELFAALPPFRQQVMEQVGLGLAELRRMAAEDGNVRRVRLILADLDSDPRPRSGERPVVWKWIRLPLIAFVGVVICLASTYLIDRYALFVGALWGMAIIWAAVGAPDLHGGAVVRGLVVAAYVVLCLLGTWQADTWYLRVRGQEAWATYVRPEHSVSHGATTLTCRIRLPDGSIREVFGNDKWCTHEGLIGTRTRAVIDPAGHYRPFLGRKSDLGIGVYDYLCLGAGVILVLTLPAALIGGVRESRSNRSARLRGAVV